MRLGGRPLLAESLERLEASEWIDAIVVAAPRDWEEPTILLAEELGCGKVSSCVAGGRTRTESVRTAVAEVADDALAVLVHDAARPLLPDAVVERVVSALGDGCDGAVPGLALADTVKRVREGVVAATVDRSDLWAVQTPQGFPAPVLREALAAAGTEASDCSGLVEARGGRIRIVPGDRRLVKVTTREDLELVEQWLRAEAATD